MVVQLGMEMKRLKVVEVGLDGREERRGFSVGEWCGCRCWGFEGRWVL